MRKFLFLLSVSALLPSISQAQESAAPLVESDGADEDARPLTITGDGFAASTELTGESVSILTRSEIEEVQGADIVRVLTRTPGRASSMPAGETLTNFAATGATLAIHLSIQNLATVVADLLPAGVVLSPIAGAAHLAELDAPGAVADIVRTCTGN